LIKKGHGESEGDDADSRRHLKTSIEIHPCLQGHVLSVAD
jgi:hypothetical protein